MKQILILSLLLFCSHAFSAYQYNTKGNQSWITFDSTTDVYFSVERSGKTNDHENFIDEGAGIADWGWYNLNTNESESFKNGLSHTFNENDKLALWVQDNTGNIYGSTKGLSNFIWGKSDTTDNVFKVYGGNKGSNGSHEYYVFRVTTAPNNTNTPSGQPLPGIIATLIIGGVSIYYIGNRKKLMKK